MRCIHILIILVLLVLVSACSGPRVVCKKPYIRVGTECCLDINDNAICDSDEGLMPVGSAIDVLKEDNENESEKLSTNDEKEEQSEIKAEIKIIIQDAFWNTMYPETDEEIELTIEFENHGDDVEEFKYNVEIYNGEKFEKEDTYKHSRLFESGKTTKIKDLEYTFSEEGDYKAKVYLENQEDDAKEITFYVNEPQEENDEEEEETEEENETTTTGCIDHDDGRTFTVSSYCEDSTGKHYDSCYRDNVVMEYYCDSLIGHTCVHTFEFDCKCENGKCV